MSQPQHSVDHKTQQNSQQDRRLFLKTAGAAGIATLASTHSLRAKDVNEQMTGAVIGCGGIASHLLGQFMESDRCQFAAVCDVDTRRSAEFADRIEKHQGKRPDIYGEFERVLDRADIDFVIVATPDHWHAPITIAACLAGKDVYCEKPCSHNILEGREMVRARDQQKSVVQVGTQTRSAPHMHAAREFVRSGKLGVISKTRTFNRGMWGPTGFGKWADQIAPKEVDYDRWLGPAPARPFNPKRFHGSFRWFYDYAGGILGDWNIHLQDIVMWTMDTPDPVSVSAFGGKYLIDDDRTTPDTLEVLYEFPAVGDRPPLIHTYSAVLALSPYNHNAHTGVGIEFTGSDGQLYTNWDDGWYVTGAPKDFRKPEPWNPENETRIDGFHKPGSRHAYGLHANNFMDCIISRESPAASIEKHNKTCTAIHLGNISYRVGRRLYWDPVNVACFKDREMTIPDNEANQLLGREYRKGYELPRV